MQQAVMQAPGLVQAPAVFNTPYYRQLTPVRPTRPPVSQGYVNGSAGARPSYTSHANNGGKAPRVMQAMAPTYRAQPPAHHPYPPTVRYTTHHYVPHNPYGCRTAASPSNTNSSSSSNTGSASGTLSTSLSNNVSTTTTCSEQLSKTNLYIRGLYQNTTDKDLVNMCSQYGTIISTKAILDKTTNKCYGFVDFESVGAAEAAVRALQSKGIQAQMAKVGIPLHRSVATQQEQDPTNLYIANLPVHLKENDVDNMLAQYGQVVSTRILRDTTGQSKGVGFARMESKEKCEQIIELLNGRQLPGAKDPLLVKFADGGNKKRTLFKSDGRPPWASPPDASAGGAMGYEHAGLPQNGVAAPHLVPATISQYGRPYGPQPVPGYSLPAGWLPQYVVPHMPAVDEQYTCQLATPAIHGYKNDNPAARGISVMMSGDPNSVHYGAMIPQLTAHMNALHLGAPTQFMTSAHGHAYPVYAVPVAEHPPASATASPEAEHYQQQ